MKFDFSSRFVTSDDLRWPHVTSRVLFIRKRRHDRHFDNHLWYFIKIQNLTFSENFSPQVTSYDLETPFTRKLTSRASFWYIIYNNLSKFEIWSFLAIFDLGLPLMTSRHLSLESWRQERHFDIQFIMFNPSPKFDLFLGFLTSGDLWWPRDTFQQKADVKSVILIYKLTPFSEVRNLTLNDPKFVIWPQTQIFSNRNNF